MTHALPATGGVSDTGHPSRATVMNLRGVSKSYGATKALIDADLTLHAGSVHGLVGQNGSGKSTLIKILAGGVSPDAGELTMPDGNVVSGLTPDDAAAARLAFVHQDLSLVDSVSVMENVLVGSLVTGRLGRIRWKEQVRRVRALLASLESDIDPRVLVATLTSAERAIVAIARALYARGTGRPALLVLDEPTAYLPSKERDLLFRAVRIIAAEGGAVLFVSHRTDEILELCDVVTVLRNGSVAATGLTEALDEAALVASIVGRSLGDIYPERQKWAAQHEPVTPALNVQDLHATRLHGVNLHARPGEILGVTGLLGMGQDDLPYLLTGATRAHSGTVAIDGVALHPLTPRNAIKHGLGLLPSDRPRDSGILTATLRENVTLVDVGRCTKIGRLRHATERALARALLQDFDVQPAGIPERTLGSLSGGNQQKVLIAKWLSDTRLRCLVLHEPAQGVDVGAKQTLLKIVAAAAERGLAVVIVSVEYGDLAAMCDRVLVLRDGAVSAELSKDQLTKEDVMRACYGH